MISSFITVLLITDAEQLDGTQQDEEQEVLSIKCPTCHKRFSGIPAFTDHLSNCKEDLLTCPNPDCTFTTNRKVALTYHIKRCQPYLCHICNYVASNETDLSSHWSDVHPNVPRIYNCQICDTKTKNFEEMRSHVFRIHHRRIYRCLHPNSEAVFPDKARYEQHRQTHVDKLECGECEYRATCKEELYVHQQVHFESHCPYACTLCPYRSKKAAVLKQHIACHENQALPYRCPICGYGSGSKTTVVKHVRSVHRGKFSYSYCQRQLYIPSLLLISISPFCIFSLCISSHLLPELNILMCKLLNETLRNPGAWKLSHPTIFSCIVMFSRVSSWLGHTTYLTM